MNSQLTIILNSVGRYFNMIKEVIRDILRHGIDMREVTKQITIIGTHSVPIILLTATFTGMVLALQTAYGLSRFGAKNYVGNIVSLAIVRELGPVLTAIMLCGRVGAGIAAEIASMVVTEQVDAIRALGADPIHKLVTPKVVGAVIAVPLLTCIANIIGIYGGILVAVLELDISAHSYYNAILYTVIPRDLFDGLFKSSVFGFILVSIACYKGLMARGGTEGVGLTTRAAVVTSCSIIFISDFFLTKLLMIFG